MSLSLSSRPENADNPLALVIRDDTAQMLASIYESELETTTRSALIIISAPPQYRAGPHRQSVALANEAARRGITALLFDLPGSGDSTPVCYELHRCIRSAIDLIHSRYPGIENLGLYGLCDSANIAINYANLDPRIDFLAISNPNLESEKTAAKVKLRRYYMARFFSREFWNALVRGEVIVRRSISAFFSTVETLLRRNVEYDDLQHMHLANELLAFPGRIQLVLSGLDATGRQAKELLSSDRLWQKINLQETIQIEYVANADHTFTDEKDELFLIERIMNFIHEK